ncbi:MAG: sugar phosphate isomerase/epimerase [Pirellulales bacterium]|nr:sugar phosphate isomerase/epimerase [Pirellulales bacterium]
MHTAARLQCDGVQIDARRELRAAELSRTGLRQLRKMLDDLNLRVGSMAFPTRRGYACAEDLELRLEVTRAAIQLASHLQARVLICHLGKLPEEQSSSERTMLSDALISLATFGNRLGVQLVAQAAATAAEQLVHFIATLPEGTLALDLHPAQLMAHGHSPLDFVSEAGQHIAHVHAVDAVYDLASGQSMEVELGRGSADFPALLGGLEAFGYRGWLTLERRNSPRVVEDIGNAVQFLRSL